MKPDPPPPLPPSVQVRLGEYNAIRTACHSLEAGYTPPITFVTVRLPTHPCASRAN
jgi:hypothetical protein